jgi:hypothetical protein
MPGENRFERATENKPRPDKHAQPLFGHGQKPFYFNGGNLVAFSGR